MGVGWRRDTSETEAPGLGPLRASGVPEQQGEARRVGLARWPEGSDCSSSGFGEEAKEME